MSNRASLRNWFRDWEYLDNGNRIALVVLLPAALIVLIKCRVQDWLATRP